ncbi:MAG: Gfo/Idh/MocA family oxidoreductase [Pseudomonadota bacterium]
MTVAVRGLAVVGLGMALAPHARALAELADRYRVVGAWSRSEPRRAAAAAAYDLPVTADLDALVADPNVDVGLILTPPASHYELAERFLDAGKHVIVEKPLDTELGRAERLVASAAAKNRSLGIVLQHRFRKAARALGALLQDGELGPIGTATCIVPWWRDQTYYDQPGRGTRERDGGGVLMTQAIHTIDLFRALTGGIGRVAAAAQTTPLHRMECEDVVAAVVELNGGAIGSLYATTAAFPGHPEEIRLVCANGVAALLGDALRVDWLDGRHTAVGEAAAMGSGADPMAFSHDAHKALLADYADALDQGRAPEADGRDGLATQRLIERLLDAAAAGSWVIVETEWS